MEKLLLPAIHLFGLVGFLVYKTKGSFINFMKTRHEEVSNGLNQAKIQAAQADARRKEVEAKFAGLQKEKEIIFAEWKEREAAQLKAIKEGTPKLIALMTAEAEQNKKSLEAQMKAQVMKKMADLIINRVEENVKAGLNPQAHQSINDKFMIEVSA